MYVTTQMQHHCTWLLNMHTGKEIKQLYHLCLNSMLHVYMDWANYMQKIAGAYTVGPLIDTNSCSWKDSIKIFIISFN